MPEDKTKEEEEVYNPIDELNAIVQVADQVSGPGITGQVHRNILEKSQKLAQYIVAAQVSLEAVDSKPLRRGRPKGSKNKKNGSGAAATTKVIPPSAATQPAV